MNLVYHREAGVELESALTHYAGIHPSLAASLLDDVESGERIVRTQPLAFRSVGGGFRIFWLRRYPFGLVYHVMEGNITVYAVAHVRRQPGYWRNRRL